MYGSLDDDNDLRLALALSKSEYEKFSAFQSPDEDPDEQLRQALLYSQNIADAEQKNRQFLQGFQKQNSEQVEQSTPEISRRRPKFGTAFMRPAKDIQSDMDQKTYFQNKFFDDYTDNTFEL